MSRSFDHASFGKAFGGPSTTWVSYATVDPETKDAPSVIFEDESGNPLPYGPMVQVTLQPSGISLACRVAMQVAGVGEGEWYPWVAGDECLVVLPEGNERGGAAIVARMNQEIDTWPAIVAGQKTTTNKIGFRRMRAPFILETASSYLIRSATTGAQFGIDAKGQVILNDGDGGSLAMGPEAVGFVSGDGETFVTLLPPTKELYLGAGPATFLLSSSGSKFISEGPVSFATAGGAASGSGVTAEQVVGFVINVITALAAGGAFNPAGPLVVPSPGTIAPFVAGALAAMGGIVPASAIPGGSFGAYVGTVFGPSGALAAALANPVAQNDPTGTIFGFGRSGFKL